MNSEFLAHVKHEAEQEYTEELFREAVEKYKEKLRRRVTLWDRLFPWRIIVVRKEDAE